MTEYMPSPEQEAAIAAFYDFQDADENQLRYYDPSAVVCAFELREGTQVMHALIEAESSPAIRMLSRLSVIDVRPGSPGRVDVRASRNHFKWQHDPFVYLISIPATTPLVVI